MAQNSVTATRVKRHPLEQAEVTHDALVTRFRAELADRASPLEGLAPAELEQARREFRDLPEVAGMPLPNPSARRRSPAK
jgi:hypothetical protein